MKQKCTIKHKSLNTSQVHEEGGGKLQKLILAVSLLIFLQTPIHLMSQDVIEGVLIVNALNDDAKPTDSRMVKSNALFNIFQQYGVTAYTQSMPFAKTPSLHDVYEIEFIGNQIQFITELEQNAANLINGIEQVYNAEELYEPEDEFWGAGNLWHLEKIQADSAWDYTLSSDSIDITIIDLLYPDIGHPDLTTKINPPYDAWDGHEFPNTKPFMFHATPVCSFAAGETTVTNGTPLGKLASSGFNSNMIYMKQDPAMLKQALFASTVLGTEVISISIHLPEHNPNTSEETIARWRAVFDEIFNNGTTIVVSAGNDPDKGPTSIFNDYIDERIITVSGTDSTDHFGVDDGNGGTTSFSHYPTVDLCAPGYNLYGPAPMQIDSITPSGDTVLITNPWPYYGNHIGTSFSAPITSGVAALIKSINPCLAPEDVQTILKSTTDPIVDAGYYNGEIGTGRLNAYKAVKLTYESYRFQNYTIQNGQDITWTEPHFIDTLYIEPNGKLTINANCFFNVNGVAMIDTAAKLTVNNSKLTTTCGNQWLGIQVWGNKNLSQLPYGASPYYYAQGRLYLNAAHIENAHEAVQLWKPGDWNSTGGHVKAINSTFTNCRRSISFYTYHNFHPYTGMPYANLSEFENCSFNLDEGYIGDETGFEGHVSLFDVEGIEFRGCDFFNDRDSIFTSNGAMMPKPYYGYGICTIGGGMHVTANNTTDSCHFQGLEYGIKADAYINKNTIYVDHSVFEGNLTGLYTSGLQSPAIVQNSFIVKMVDTTEQNTFGGVFLDNFTSGFIVEENIFSDGEDIGGPYAGLTQSVGLTINNSGRGNNQIYNNDFQNLYVGVLAQNQNRSIGGRNGLQILCNQFANIEFDIAVTADTANPFAPENGIKWEQGINGSNIENPAGNIFALSSETPIDAWDIYTETGKVIRYYYHANQNGHHLLPDSITPLVVQPFPVITLPFIRIDACPPNYSGGGGGGREGLEQEMADMDFKADSTAVLLASLKDGGDTYNTNADVENADDDQTMEVRDDLLEKSPYLTDTVMVSTVLNTDAMPAAMVTEILLENPHSARSDTVMDAVYARADISNSQIDQIEANEMVIGAMQELEGKTNIYTARRDNALARLVNIYKTDTAIVAANDSLIALLNNCNWPEAKYMLAFEYLNMGMLQTGLDTLQSIPSNFQLGATASSVHANYVSFYNIMKQLGQSGYNIMQLSQAQKQSLYQIAASSGKPSAWAANILKFADTLTYTEQYILPDASLKRGEVRRRNRYDRTVESSSLKLYPNPAREYVIIEYALEGDGTGYMIKIADANGFLRQTIKPEANRGFAVIDTRRLETGTFIAIVSKEGKFVGTGKFIVVN